MKFASCFAALVTAFGECGPEDHSGDHFPVESRALQKSYTVDHAIHFDITYGSNFKVLNNHLGMEQYVLTMCNSEAPKAEAVDAVAPLADGFTRKHFTIPLQSYGSDTTGPQGYFDIIGVLDRQKYASSYITHSCLQKAVGCSADMLAASAWGDADAVALHKEQIESVDGFFRDYGDVNSPKTIACHSYLDPHVLNRAEWVKFVAAFFNLEDAAEKHMKDEEEIWETLSAEAAAKPTTPLVAFVAASTWSGNLQISLAAYKTSLVAAAGGRSFTTDDFASNEHAVITGADPNPTIAFNMTDPAAAAAFRAALADVDVLIDETYAWDPTAYTAESFAANFGFDGAGARIFREDGLLGGVNGNRGMDWFEGAYANPSVLLVDFVAALHSTDAERTYLRSLNDGETSTIMEAEDCEKDLPICNDVDAAAEIGSPYCRYQTCTTAAPAAETTAAPAAETEDVSSGMAAGLLLAAVALA